MGPLPNRFLGGSVSHNPDAYRVGDILGSGWLIDAGFQEQFEVGCPRNFLGSGFVCSALGLPYPHGSLLLF